MVNTPRLSLLDLSTKDISDVRKKHRLDSSTDFYMLNIYFEVEINFIDNTTEITSKIKRDYIEHLTILYMDVISNLLRLNFVMNMHFPGSSTFGDIQIIIDEEEYFTSGYNGYCYEKAFRNYEEKKWPKVDKIPFEKIYNWLDNKECFFLGITSNKIERAIIALTNASKYSAELTSELLWSMVGIESLYCDSKNNLVKNLNDNTQAYLGERKEFKKSIKKMYDIRSKFIHGSMELVSLNMERVSLKHNDIYNDLNSCCDLSISILVATIQRMIIESRDVLEFEKITIVSDIPSPNTPVSETPVL